MSPREWRWTGKRLGLKTKLRARRPIPLRRDGPGGRTAKTAVGPEVVHLHESGAGSVATPNPWFHRKAWNPFESEPKTLAEVKRTRERPVPTPPHESRARIATPTNQRRQRLPTSVDQHFHASGDVRAAPQAARDEALKSPIRRREEALGGDRKPLPNAAATPRKWRGRETATEKTVTGPEKSGNTRLRFRRRPGILRKRAATPAGEHRTRKRPVSTKSLCG